MKGEILNPEADTEKQKYFDHNGKTTLENLSFLINKDYVENLKMDISLLRIDQIIGHFFTDKEVVNFLESRKLSRSERILKFLNTKHIYKDTGEPVIKDNCFIEFYFLTKYDVKVFRQKLRNNSFSSDQLQDFVWQIENDNNILEKE